MFIEEKGVFEFSIVPIEVVAYLKVVRAVQSLQSIRLLQQNGLIIDFYSIGRCIFDCVNEVDFLLEKYPEVSTTAKKFLPNFRESTIDDLLEDGTKAVLSKKIRNAGARVRASENHITFEQAKASLDKTFKNFSNYVHGQYSHIMEIYGGHPTQLKFQVGGIPSEKRKSDYLVWIDQLDSMVIFTLFFMAQQFGCIQVFKEILAHITEESDENLNH